MNQRNTGTLGAMIGGAILLMQFGVLPNPIHPAPPPVVCGPTNSACTAPVTPNSPAAPASRPSAPATPVSPASPTTPAAPVAVPPVNTTLAPTGGGPAWPGATSKAQLVQSVDQIIMPCIQAGEMIVQDENIQDAGNASQSQQDAAAAQQACQQTLEQLRALPTENDPAVQEFLMWVERSAAMILDSAQALQQALTAGFTPVLVGRMTSDNAQAISAAHTAAAFAAAKWGVVT